MYLLPDKTKGGKKKTKTRKNTLNPDFDEILTVNMWDVCAGPCSSTSIAKSVCFAVAIARTWKGESNKKQQININPELKKKEIHTRTGYTQSKNFNIT